MPTDQEIADLRRLVKNGFYDLNSFKDKEKDELKHKIKKDINGIPNRLIEKIAAADTVEVYKDAKQFPVYVKLGYPKPKRKFRLIYELYQQSVEENYFWILNHLRSDMGLNEVIKINDIFSASEQSAVWGNSQQRQAIQQDRVANFLRVISEMIKTGLFQQLRELRAIDERLEYYKGGSENDLALKGMWIDLVEGGGKNPSSVYGLSSQVGFVTLPDLFFRTYIKETDLDKARAEISRKAAEIEKNGFNKKVIEVLKRKLTQFVTWRAMTKKELEQRRNFSVKFLRQHYNSIKLYMSWIKPYLKNLKRLTMDEKRQNSPDMITSFEGSMMEIEIMARRRVGTYKESEKYTDTSGPMPVEKTKTVEKDMYAVVLATFLYRSRPSLNYQSENWQRGPIHVGRTEMDFRAYAWNEDDCRKYLALKEQETFDMLGDYDSTLKDIFDQFEGELKKYLIDLGEKFDETKKDAKAGTQEQITPFGLLEALGDGFKELFKNLVPEWNDSKKDEGAPDKKKLEGAAKGVYEFAIWNVYKNYKKAHGMLSW